MYLGEDIETCHTIEAYLFVTVTGSKNKSTSCNSIMWFICNLQRNNKQLEIHTHTNQNMIPFATIASEAKEM